MKPAHSFRFLIAALVFALAATFTVAAAQPDIKTSTRVSVDYLNPHNFTENRLAGFGHGYDHREYLQKLRAFVIRKAAAMLTPGQHLSVTFTNIKLAGDYEPWHGPQWNDVRFMRDIYPPRFAFTFKLTDANGEVVREGTRKLTGLDYLHESLAIPGDTDPLRYDKALLARWLRRGPAHW